MKAAVTEYMKKAQELLLMGYRVPLGDQFLFIYPSINVSVKDEINPDTGAVIKPATADMVKVASAIGKVAATVSTKFSKRFDLEVSWQRVDDKGNEVEDDDITDNGNQNGQGTGTGGNTGGNGSQSSDDDLEG